MAVIRTRAPFEPRRDEGNRAAVFLDKDGTLVHDVPFNVDPDRIVLRDGAAAALARLRAAGYALVLVTNQSGVALGRFAERELAAVWERLDVLLAPEGARLDAIYYCPHHESGSAPGYARPCACRKPSPGLLLHAAADHGIDLWRSWLVGDILDDVEAGRRAGCRTVLLDVGSETEWRHGAHRMPLFVAHDWAEVADLVVAEDSALREAGSREVRPARRAAVARGPGPALACAR